MKYKWGGLQVQPGMTEAPANANPDLKRFLLLNAILDFDFKLSSRYIRYRVVVSIRVYS